jgi:cellobiose-specific phosphotransferase system component IIC
VLVFYDNLNRSNLLKVWAEEMTNGSVWTIPDATINGVYYRGTVDASDIAEISCASLKQRPKGCSEFFEEPVSDSSSMTAVLVILMALFMAVMIGAIIIMVYRKTVRREITNEMSTKVTEMVTKYASLVEEH